MLARNGVILSDDHLFSHRPRILFCNVKISGALGAHQFDFLCGWLRHLIPQLSAEYPASRSAVQNHQFRGDILSERTNFRPLFLVLVRREDDLHFAHCQVLRLSGLSR